MTQLIKCCGGCIVQLLWVTLIIAQPNISRIEYYLDKDPGYGNGKSINFTADTNISDLRLTFSPSAFTTGVHLLGIRAQDADGTWSVDNKWLFAKPFPPAVKAGIPPNLIQAEYYIDKDPGYGKGVPIAISALNNLADMNFAVNISGLAAGDHNLFIRSKDAKNSWSPDNVYVFTVDATIASPSIVVNSIARKKLCQLDSLDVSYEAKGNYRSGNIFNVVLSDSAGDFSAPTTIGSFTGTGNSIIKCNIPYGLAAGTQYKIRIESTNPVVTGVPGIDSITINTLPSPVIMPADTIVILQGDNINLATTSRYKSYLWSTSAKTPTIQVKKYGSYTVKVTDNNNCSATSAPVLVKVTPVITSSGPVSDLCPGTSVTLTSSVAASYLWNTEDTTQSITVTAPGTYYLVVNGGGKGDTSAPVSVTFNTCGNPVSLSSTNISDGAVSLNWDKVPCAHHYELQYSLLRDTAWNIVSTSDTGTSYNLSGLPVSTTYQWQVRTVCADSPVIVSSFSSIESFTTSGPGIAAKSSPAQQASVFTASLYPNPSTHNAILQLTGNKTKLKILITDIAGKVLWQRDKINRNVSLPVEGFSAGTYLVIIKDDNHQQTLKLVKN